MSGDAQARLVRALARAAGGLHLLEAHHRDWWSATFDGIAHWLRFAADADAAARLAALAPEALAVPGRRVAELVVEPAGDGALWVTALTLAAA